MADPDKQRMIAHGDTTDRLIYDVSHLVADQCDYGRVLPLSPIGIATGRSWVTNSGNF